MNWYFGMGMDEDAYMGWMEIQEEDSQEENKRN